MFFRSLLPAFLWALFILIICGIPGQRIPRVDFLDWLKPDKIVHLFIFGLLSYLLIRGFMKKHAVAWFESYPRLSAVLLTVAYGILIEILQEYIFIDRSGEVFDAIADAIGALLGMWVFNYFRKRKVKRQSSS